MAAMKPFVKEPEGTVANYPYFERGKDSTTAYLYRLFQERIVMFDGAMGTMIQKYRLGEEEYRGERYKVRKPSSSADAMLRLGLIGISSTIDVDCLLCVPIRRKWPW